MTAQTTDPKTAQKHRALLDSTLPMLSASWQKDILRIVDSDARDDRNAPTPGIELVLAEGERPALEKTASNRFTLTYCTDALDSARAALLAVATLSGLPIAGDNKSLAHLTLAERVAKSDIPVLIDGPTGTGKEVLSRFIHVMSPRKDGPFVAVNCAAVPEAMLEAQLFGHRKGAFTGASEANEGLFRAADKGTLLLDEVGEIPLALQSKLLRALQEGEVTPLGSTRPVRFDTRIIASTNRRLGEEVKAGRFREDLFYRLNVFPLRITALRARRGDIAPLAFGMLLRHSCLKGKPCWIDPAVIATLEAHPWPGNVRELENVIRRAILLAGNSDRLLTQHIVFDRAVSTLGQESEARAHTPAQSRADARFDQADEMFAQDGSSAAASLSDIAFRSEANAIIEALNSCGGHRGKTARQLGISERTLRYRLASMRETGLLASNGARQ